MKTNNDHLNFTDVTWKDNMLEFMLEFSNNDVDFSQQVLRLIAKYFGYKYLIFVPYYDYENSRKKSNSKKQVKLALNVLSYNVEHSFLSSLWKVAWETSIFSPAKLQPMQRIKRVLTVTDLMSYDEYEKTPWCTILQTGDLYYHASVHLLNASNTAQLASLNIFRTKDEGEFTDSDLQLLEYLSGFLSKMYQMCTQQSSDNWLKTSVNGGLKDLALGVIYLNDRMGVLEANTMAHKLAKEYLQDFNEHMINRITICENEEFRNVQRMIDDVCTDLLNESSCYIKSTDMGKKYRFYSTHFVSFGALGVLSNRWLVFLQKDTESESKAFYTGLTNREREILRFILQGVSNKQISMDLNISIYTVRSHVHNIYQKFNAKSRVELLTILK